MPIRSSSGELWFRRGNSQMTREEAVEQIKKCLAHLRADDDRPEHQELKYVQARPVGMFPALTRYVLCEMLGLHCYWWPGEKVRWEVRAVYRDYPVSFEDRKLGFAIIVPERMPPEILDELLSRLKGSMRILANHLRATSKQKIEAGQFTIVNQFYDHDERYRYFRERARANYASPPPPPERVQDPSGMYTCTSYDRFKPEREGSYDTVAMLHEYFSRLEHVMILLLPSVRSFVPAKGRLCELMSSGWREKLQAALELQRDAAAKRLYDRLFELKETLRNPQAHGGFLKNGASAWFHQEGIGALPMDLLDSAFDFRMVPLPKYEEICALLDEVDQYLDAHPELGYGMMAVRSGLDARFDPDSLREYRQVMERSDMSGDRSIFENYVQGMLRKEDMYDNYEE
jgi:hypothetical protein